MTSLPLWLKLLLGTLLLLSIAFGFFGRPPVGLRVSRVVIVLLGVLSGLLYAGALAAFVLNRSGLAGGLVLLAVMGGCTAVFLQRARRRDDEDGPEPTDDDGGGNGNGAGNGARLFELSSFERAFRRWERMRGADRPSRRSGGG